MVVTFLVEGLGYLRLQHWSAGGRIVLVALAVRQTAPPMWLCQPAQVWAWAGTAELLLPQP